MTMTETAWFADRIRSERLRREFTQVQMAAQLGVTPSTYENWEAGRNWPRFAEFQTLCAYFGWPHAATVAMGLYLDAVGSKSLALAR